MPLISSSRSGATRTWVRIRGGIAGRSRQALRRADRYLRRAFVREGRPRASHVAPPPRRRSVSALARALPHEACGGMSRPETRPGRRGLDRQSARLVLQPVGDRLRGHPELDIRISWDGKTSLATVTIEQQQRVDTRTPVFRIPTLMRFRIAGRDVDVPIEVREAHQTFRLRLDGEPTQAIFDPGHVVLAARKVESPSRCGERSSRTRRSRSIARRQRRRSHTAVVTRPRKRSRRRCWPIDSGGYAARPRGARTASQHVRARSSDQATARRGPSACARAIARALGEFVQDAEVGAALAKVVDKAMRATCRGRGVPRARQDPHARAGELLRKAATRESFTD